MSFWQCEKCGGTPGVTWCCTDKSMTANTETGRADFDRLILETDGMKDTGIGWADRNPDGTYKHKQIQKHFLTWQAARCAPVVAVPQGWELVPEKASSDMVNAGEDAFCGTYDYAMIPDVYAAMLAAAPQPPEAATDDSSGVGSLIESREVVSTPKSGLTVTRLNLSEAGRAALQSKATHISVVSGAVAAPVQMPEPWAISHHNRVQYSNAAWHGETPDGTKLYTEHQVRQLLAAHGIN